MGGCSRHSFLSPLFICLPVSPSLPATVAFVIESTVGGLLLKSGLRFLGTANAGLLGMA